MTLNEFRATRNLPPVADGDKLRSAYILWSYGAWSDAWNEEQEIVDLDKDFEKPIMKDLELKKKIDWIIEKSIKEGFKELAAVMQYDAIGKSRQPAEQSNEDILAQIIAPAMKERG